MKDPHLPTKRRPEELEDSIVDLISLPWQPDAFCLVVRHVFSANECDGILGAGEAKGLEQATINVGGGEQQVMSRIRNSKRAIFDSVELGQILWSRICDARGSDYSLSRAPWTQRKLRSVGLNERLRILKYDPGEYFAPHYDGEFERGREFGVRCGERSYVTCQIYLNEGFSGGTTRFLNPHNLDEFVDVVPEQGAVLLFQHDLLHEGCCVTQDVKWTLRTDVMYAQDGCPYPTPIKKKSTCPQNNTRAPSSSSSWNPFRAIIRAIN